MKGIKKLVFALLFACIGICMAILVCALVPGLSDRVAEFLYGRDGMQNQQEENMGIPEHVISANNTPGIQWEDMPFLGFGTYEIPSGELLEIPKELLEKNGYAGVMVDTQEEEEPQEPQKEPFYGELGQEYSFSQLLYPYYAMLRDDMKRLYHQLYANANQRNTSFVPVVAVSPGELQTVFEALVGDHPELFWLDTGYQCAKRGDLVTEITLQYYSTVDRLESARAQFDRRAEEILSAAQGLATEEEKEAFVHDRLIELVEYNRDAAMNQSAYSALVGGESVCAGYARAFQYLMQELGIPCYYCTGYAGENHAWNIILVNGHYQNVDVTWDDVPEGSRDYYNCSDRAYSGTHRRKGLSVYLPACTEDTEQAESDNPMIGLEGLINPNPTKPLTLEQPGNIYPGEGEEQKEDLSQAGIHESDVVRSLEAYYRECERRMTELGSGQVQFSICIPVSLWDSIESAYSTGAHREGYADQACKTLKVDYFAIYLQAVRLGGGYYRIYHTVATW